MKKKNIIEHTVSSGNIFADLGFPDAEERLAKLDLAIRIFDIIKKKRLTQAKAAELLEIDQPKISALSQGKLSGFSLERLFRFLTILGQDITIQVTPKKSSKKQAHVSVNVPKRRKWPVVKSNEILSGKVLHAKKKK
jgi:predicted XRE-type DNA-binding protein